MPLSLLEMRGQFVHCDTPSRNGRGFCYEVFLLIFSDFVFGNILLIEFDYYFFIELYLNSLTYKMDKVIIDIPL